MFSTNTVVVETINATTIYYEDVVIIYINTVQMNISNIKLDDNGWKDFLGVLQKEYSKVEFAGTDRLRIYISDYNITEYDIKMSIAEYLSKFLDERRKPLEIICEKDEEKILPIEEKVDVKTYLLYSTRLAILQAYPELQEMIMKSFVDIKVYYNEKYFNYFFFEENLDEMLSFQHLSYNEICDKINIIEYTKNCINNEDYVNVHLDEYFCSNKDNFNKSHFVHENLIYGYSDEMGIFFAYGFTKKQVVGCFTISYVEYMDAYEKGKIYFFCGAAYLEHEYPWAITLCHVKPLQCYVYTIGDFLSELECYLYPKKNEMVQEDQHVYGINVYSYIADWICSNKEHNPIDFRTFNLLYEHKICIKKRVEFLAKKYH